MSVLKNTLKAVLVWLMAITVSLLSIGLETTFQYPGTCLAAPICLCDHDLDGDVDGADVAAAANGTPDLMSLSGSFGSQDCGTPDAVALIGPDGGSLQAAGDITVLVPPGALSEPTFIGVSPLDPVSITVFPPDLFAFAAGISLFTGGAVFDVPVRVTLPPTLALDEGQQVAVVQAVADIDLDGADDWLLVDRALHQSGLIETQSEYFPGLTGCGNFAFLISDSPFAYVALTNIVGAEAPASMAYNISAGQPFVGTGILVSSDYPGIGSPVIDGRSIAMIKAGFDAHKAILVADMNNDNVFGLHTFDNLTLSRDELKLVEELIEVKDSPAQVKEDARTYVVVKEENVAPGAEFLQALQEKLLEQIVDIQDEVARNLKRLPVYASSHLDLEKDLPGSITANVGLLKDKIIPLDLPITFTMPDDNLSFTVPAETVALILFYANRANKQIIDLVAKFFGSVESAPVTIQILNAFVTEARILNYRTEDFVPVIVPQVSPFPHTMDTTISGDEITVTLTTSVLGDGVAMLGMKLPATFGLEASFGIASQKSQCADTVNLPDITVTPTVETFVAQEVVVNVLEDISEAEATFILPPIANTTGTIFLDMAEVNSPDDLHDLEYRVRVECFDAQCNGLDENSVRVYIDGNLQNDVLVTKGNDMILNPECEDQWQSMCDGLSSEVANCEASGWVQGMCEEWDFDCWNCEDIYIQWVTECWQSPCEPQPMTYLDVSLSDIDLLLDDPLTPDINEGFHTLYLTGVDGNENTYSDTATYTLPSVIWEETWDFDWGDKATCLGHPVSWNEGVEAHQVVYGAFADVHGGLWEGWTYEGPTSQECAWMDDPFYKNYARTADGICMGPPAHVCSDGIELIHYDGDYFNFHGTIYGIYIDPGIDAHFACDVATNMLSISYFKTGPDGTAMDSTRGSVRLYPAGTFDIGLRDVAPIQFADIGFHLVGERLWPMEGAVLGPCRLYLK